jgi:hypothetical protein
MAEFGRYATRVTFDRADASRKRSSKAKNMAQNRLVHRHKNEYDELYATALAELAQEKER